MKKTASIIVSILLLLLVVRLNSQTQNQVVNLTQNAIFDTVYDRFGNKYPLSGISKSSLRPFGGSASVTSLPTNSCSAGIFNLYYAPGSWFDFSAPAQSVVCQLFTDISNFLITPLSSTASTVKINIYCENELVNPATASPVYLFPAAPSNSNAGIVNSAIQDAIFSGNDPFNNLPSQLFGGSNNFYHGYIRMNASNFTWNYNMSATTISDLDLYTILLHEAGHLLGVASLINSNGFSQFASASGNNYFARWDKFLKHSSGVPLLTPATVSLCPTSSMSYTSTLAYINPSACTNTGNVINVTTCTNSIVFAGNTYTIPIYTPFCWESGSSISHFEDYCAIPSGATVATSCYTTNGNSNNDLYYVVSNVGNPNTCFIKRYFKEEERSALCDLGYSTYSVYASPAALASHTYAGSCTGVGVWGKNDGLVNNVYSFTTTTGQILIPITQSITSNDSPNTTTITCVQSVYNNATVSITGGTLSITSPTGSGFAVIKYLPVSNTGEIGSPTYIFCYFLPGGCDPANTCNLVQNAGFENTLPIYWPCGTLGNTSYDAVVSCWTSSGGTPDYFLRGCWGPGGTSNLGTNTWGITPPVDSYNGTPNNAVVGMLIGEAVKNNLSSPLLPNQPYEISLWAMNHPTATVINGTTPLVLTVWSAQNFIYTPTLTPLMEFTVSQSANWTQFTNTFVFTPTVNNTAIVIAIDFAKTMSLGLGSNQQLYVFLDDIRIRPLPAPTFSIPNSTSCGNTSFTNLAQYASTVGVFAGPSVTLTGGQYKFNSPPSLSPGLYPVSFTYTDNTGCIATLWQNVAVSPVPTINVSGSNNICSNMANNSATLSVSCTSCIGTTAYLWEPGSLSGNSVVVSPTISTIYTITPSGNYCNTTQTLLVYAQASCCTQSVTAVSTTSSSVSQSTINSSSAFNWDYTISAGTWVFLTSGEYLFASNTKLIVESGAVLHIKGAHLYSCDNNMWDGIVLKDGGKIISAEYLGKDNLIEDAKTAIAHNSTGAISTSLTTIDCKNTTFNKNYIDIEISDYTRSVNNYPFWISNCVFTCRALPFTSSTWPSTSYSSTANTSSAELRTAINSTTGSIAPYLAQNGFTVAYLKSPYSTSHSKIAINLKNVGVTTSSLTVYGINIGTTTASTDFNLFDSHTAYIFAMNSNMSLRNNVFQNTISGSIFSSSSGSTHGGYPGAAVSSYVDGLMNTSLDMAATSPTIGNKFWDCSTGIRGASPYLLDVQNSLFRSTQSSTNSAVNKNGIVLSTNRFGYYIAYNEFTNLSSAINLAVASGSYSFPGSSSGNGVYANAIRIFANTFSAGTATNSYMNQAVYVGGVNNTPWFVPTYSVSPFVAATAVNLNTLTGVTNGISIDNSTGFQVDVEDNVISLENKNAQQYGIKMSNCIPTSSTSIGKNIISSNTASFSAPSVTANTQSALIFLDNNGYGLQSPSVSCNVLKQGYAGFVFDNKNEHAIWGANIMELPMKMGMVLQNAGVIGTQGASLTAIANRWTGGTWSGTNYHTFTSASGASLSPLWLRIGGDEEPSYSSGNPFPWSYGSSNNYSSVGSIGSGDYNCSQFPNHKTIHIPLETEYDNVNLFYMAKTALYRFLHFNDSILNAPNPDAVHFYSDLGGSSIEAFMQVEENIYSGELGTASSINNDISTSNTVEENYKNFYRVCINYAANEYEPTSYDDSTTLHDLATLCPGTDGACVNQAIALYNRVFKVIVNPVCVDIGSRSSSNAQGIPQVKEKNSWDCVIFPNPTNDQLNILTKTEENGYIAISISDLSGRKMLSKRIKTKDFIGKLDLDLTKGAYLINITNSKNETITKKLLISE